MRNKNRSNWKFLHQEEGDFEETVVRQSRRYPKKRDNMEDFRKTTNGRNPENSSAWRERDNRSYWHSVGEAYYDIAEMTDGGMAETSPFTQVLQVRKSKTKKCMKCPPVITSGKMPRSYWEDKPMLVMKVIKRIRCRQYRDTPQNGSPLSSSSTEKEVPADSCLVSEANRFQDRHQSEDRERNATNQMQITKIWASQVNLREDSSETAEKKQISVKEKEENGISGTKVQLLQTDQKAADEQRNEKGEVTKNSLSEMERCNQELQEECTKRIHQLGEEMSTLKVKKQNFESRDEQLIGDKQQLPKDYHSSEVKVDQLDEVNTKMSSYKTLVVPLEDKKREQTEQMQNSVPKQKDLLQQIENMQNIPEKEEQMPVQLYQLLQETEEIEDICGQDKKWKKWFSLFFSKASKTGKETKAEVEAATNMTGEEIEKKSRKWFPRFFFSKLLKMEKEAKT